MLKKASALVIACLLMLTGISAFAADSYGGYDIPIDIDINGKIVLVIDDMLTTGSSLNECARVLKANGANKVFGLCLCSVKE